MPDRLEPGEAYEWGELESLFDTSFFPAGMHLRNTDEGGQFMVLFSTDEGPYRDRISEQGSFQYIGEGLPENGDQRLTTRNRALVDAIEDPMPIYFFARESDDPPWQYQRLVEVLDCQYVEQDGRSVFRFQLRKTDPDDYIEELLPAGAGAERPRVEYIDDDHPSMQEARHVKEAALADDTPIDENRPIGAVLVDDDTTLATGTNGSEYHVEEGCTRQELREQGEDIPSGEGYDLCEGCGPEHHAEQTAIDTAYEEGHEDLEGADIYMWGHWWCCDPCWDRMLEEGIDTVYLPSDAHTSFADGAVDRPYLEA